MNCCTLWDFHRDVEKILFRVANGLSRKPEADLRLLATTANMLRVEAELLADELLQKRNDKRQSGNERRHQRAHCS